ncbi:MAG TPA: ATP-dependent DNA helicase RecG [Caulobacteraceae bacterium]|jgi:ATP-dependent DNA helicase RecG|nr:ATP-dependent DNA helicase RecG [Caulobacteraceae bacterium]
MRPESLFPLFAPVTTLKGVGTRVAPLLEKVAGPRVRDVLFLAPQGLIHRQRTSAADARHGEVQTLEVTIESHHPPPRPGLPWKIRAFDETGFVNLVYFKGHGPHLQARHPAGSRRIVSGRIDRESSWSTLDIVHPDYLAPMERAGDVPTIEPVYPATAGLPSRTIRRFAAEALSRAPDLVEWQDPAWLSRNAWPSWRQALEALHAPRREADLGPAAPHRRRLAFDELLAHQLALGERRSIQRRGGGPVIDAPTGGDRAAAALPFSLTGAQKRAVEAIRADIRSGERMSRLLQGDVGSGKTAVAMIATADAAQAGWQAAFMAPTELLARQHFASIEPALLQAGFRCVLLTGRHKGAARSERLEALASGEAHVAVGTHALFQDDVSFRRLGLAVVDEQHRFGVSERLRLQAKGEGTHLLAMSATPIPRTLELTVFGDLDVSRLDEKPPGRTPVETRAAPITRLPDIVTRLRAAVAAGAQAFWICPLVAESEAADLAAAESRAAALSMLFGPRVGLVHGRLAPAERDATMARYLSGELSVLVATTVVEVGVDVPAATIMVIEQAERFGLAQLHQLRGRVGRGAAASSCILLYEPPLSEIARTRLDVLRRTDDGFVIAERDLELRGGGDPLGLVQSGFPAYVLADPIAHRDLVAAAADDARLVLARDPDLSSTRGQALRLLRALFDWRADGALSSAG